MTLDIDRYREQMEQLFIDHDVVLAYLFGSQAEGKAGPLSDVDIAVLLASQVEKQDWFQIQLDLVNESMDLFHRNDVNILILNEATPVIAHQVVRYGRVIFEAQPGTRVDYELNVLRRYVDTAPLRRLQDRRLLERVEEYRQAMRPMRTG